MTEVASSSSSAANTAHIATNSSPSQDSTDLALKNKNETTSPNIVSKTIVDHTAETDRSFPSSIEATPLSSPDVSAPSSPRHRKAPSFGAASQDPSPDQVEELHSSLKEASNANTADSWLDVQQKTFLRWANFYLRSRHVQVDNIATSFTDGNALNNLLEVLSNKKLKKWKHPAKLQVHRVDNLQISLEFMNNEGVKLVNVRAQELEHGNPKITLGLLWSLITHYQILRFAEQKKKAAEAELRAKEAREAAERAAKEADQIIGEDDGSARAAADEAARYAEEATKEAEKSKVVESQMSAKADLLQWVNKKLQQYDVPIVRDFTSSWTNGVVLMALVDALDSSNTSEIQDINPEHPKKELGRTSDTLVDTQAAVDRAEKALRIPPLMDPYDIVNRPDEQAMMTYVACFRNWEAAVDNLPVGVVAGAMSVEKAPEVAVAAAVATETATTEGGSSSEGTTEAVPFVATPVAAEPEVLAADPVVEPEQKEAAMEAGTATVLPEEEEKAPTPEFDAKEVVEEKTSVPEAVVGVAPNVELESKPSTPKEVQVCISTTDQNYIHSQKDGSLRCGELNSQWSTWTVIDSTTSDVIYFRDAFGRYLNCSSDGKVFLADQTEESAWKVVRGEVQHFISIHGLYLTPSANHTVSAVPQPTNLSALTLCFPVVEGMLRKKGRSGLRRWQDRYFAFNGAVMTYWHSKDAVRSGNPNGIYYPNKISKVEVSKEEPNRFSIHFLDDAVVELEAANQFECARWVRALNITGANKPIDPNRWTVVKP